MDKNKTNAESMAEQISNGIKIKIDEARRRIVDANKTIDAIGDNFPFLGVSND